MPIKNEIKKQYVHTVEQYTAVRMNDVDLFLCTDIERPRRHIVNDKSKLLKIHIV